MVFKPFIQLKSKINGLLAPPTHIGDLHLFQSFDDFCLHTSFDPLRINDNIFPMIDSAKAPSLHTQYLFHLLSILRPPHYACSDSINMLEIGTFDAVNICSLASLYPNVKFTTYDLPSTDKTFRNTYNRATSFSAFASNRNALLKSCTNVKFIESDSTLLTRLEASTSSSYDLIWIDGAHGYPQCTIDITNSFSLIKPGGWILCDDVFLAGLISEDAYYRSYSAFSTLTTFLRLYHIIDAFLLPKSEKNFTKFIAAIHFT